MRSFDINFFSYRLHTSPKILTTPESLYADFLNNVEITDSTSPIVPLYLSESDIRRKKTSKE